VLEGRRFLVDADHRIEAVAGKRQRAHVSHAERGVHPSLRALGSCPSDRTGADIGAVELVSMHRETEQLRADTDSGVKNPVRTRPQVPTQQLIECVTLFPARDSQSG
jgi:hypothetical protein